MIGIVGGGIAGLAAAYRLQERGREVRVFEAGDAVGGLAATYETGGTPPLIPRCRRRRYRS